MFSTDQLRLRLGAYIGARLGLNGVRVAEFERVAVGHSRGTYRIVVTGSEGCPRAFAVRVEQGGVFGTSSATEVRLMRALAAAGVPVARVRWYEDDRSVIGHPFFVMDWVEGNPGAADKATLYRYAEVLEELHCLDWRRAGLPLAPEPLAARDGARLQIDRWEAVYRGSRYLPIPLLDEAAAWLRRHAPPARHFGVVHGDPGPSNFLHANGEAVLLTDWEFCHLGDPVEDWVYLITMRGSASMPRDEWLALIGEVAGIKIGQAELDFWEAFNQFKGACANITTLRIFSEGVNPAPNMAAIGTALHMRMLQRIAEIVGASYSA